MTLKMIDREHELVTCGSLDSRIEGLLAAAKEVCAEQRKLLDGGTFFNCFSALGMKYKETVHSRIMKILLDPGTRHGYGQKFWDLFFETLKETMGQSVSEFGKIDWSECVEVSCEYFIGPISNDYERGGYIDILIRTSNAILVFENKINAGDQQKQLYRYANWAGDEARTCNVHSFVIYLTPDGRLPTQWSLKGDKGTVAATCISYGFVEKWLKRCIDVCGGNPRVRTFLVQYLEIVQEIIGSRKDGAVMKIHEYLIKNNLLESAAVISAAYVEARPRMISSIVEEACMKSGIELTMELSEQIVRFAAGNAPSCDPCIISSLKQENEYVAGLALAHEGGRTYVGIAMMGIDEKIHDRIINAAQGVAYHESTEWWPVSFCLEVDIFDDSVLDDAEQRRSAVSKMADHINVLSGIFKKYKELL